MSDPMDENPPAGVADLMRVLGVDPETYVPPVRSSTNTNPPVVTVAPKGLRPDSWLHEPRFTEFVEAYRFAAGHFSQAAPAFAKVTPEDAYWIWKTITTGVERNRREREESR